MISRENSFNNGRYMEDCLDMSLRDFFALINRPAFRPSYLGIETLRNPLDLCVCQEIIYEMRPDFVVEIGTHHGGGALALAHFMDAIGCGHIVTVDIDHEHVAEAARRHPRITLVTGDACASFETVAARVSGQGRVMVIEDSSHTYENTLQVIRRYSDLVGIGCYLIVEDGIFGHGFAEGPAGAYEAIETFSKEDCRFAIDRDRERFFLTFNPKGYLRRVK